MTTIQKPMDELLLTSAEAAQILRVAQRTVTNMAARGDLKATRVGNRWRFPKAALLHALGAGDTTTD